MYICSPNEIPFFTLKDMEIISGRKTPARKKPQALTPMADMGKLQPQARELE